MTAGERLVQLAGAGGTAAALLVAISLAGSTAGDRLVSRSGLGTDTAAAHLLAEAQVVTPPATGGGGGGAPARKAPARASYVDARLLVYGDSWARLSPVVGQASAYRFATGGTSAATFAPTQAQVQRAGLAAGGTSAAAFTARVSVTTTLAASGQGVARFHAAVDDAPRPPPIRPRVELADDEIVAILQLMAA